MADDSEDFVIAICNFTPEVRSGYRVGMPKSGVYHEVFNSDWEAFGGSDVRNDGELLTEDIAWQDRPQSLTLTLPPLATIYLRWQGGLPEVLLAEKKLPVRKRRQTSGTEESALVEPAAKKPRRKPAEKKAETKPPARGRKKAGELAAPAAPAVAKPDNNGEQALSEKKPSRKKATAAGEKKPAEQEQVRALTAKVPRTKAAKPASVKKAVKPATEDKKKASK
jgi:1,4-alpha-glucan branching enzyme